MALPMPKRWVSPRFGWGVLSERSDFPLPGWKVSPVRGAFPFRAESFRRSPSLERGRARAVTEVSGQRAAKSRRACLPKGATS